jgi:hypothetical protein
MTDADGRAIGRLIDSLVPPLPERPDRLVDIQRRARRQRRWTVALAGAGVLILLIGAWALLPGARPSAEPMPPIGADGSLGPTAGDCPSSPPSNFEYDNLGLPSTGPGVLAPEGAIRAIMCVYQTRVPWDEPEVRELVLTRDVAGLVAELNRLPAKPGVDPCFIGGGGGYLTLIYPDGTEHVIEFAIRCSFVRRGAITRHDGYRAVQAFEERYREQGIAAARADTIPAADCASRLTVDAAADWAPNRIMPEQVHDAWLRTSGEDRRYLAAPAAVVTACRYERRGDLEFRRSDRVTSRSVAGRVDAAVQTAYRTYPTRKPYDDCGPIGAIGTIDVLVIRDSVGETTEVRLPRDACQIVSFGDEGGRTPNGDLTALLDELLGPVD